MHILVCQFLHTCSLTSIYTIRRAYTCTLRHTDKNHITLLVKNKVRLFHLSDTRSSSSLGEVPRKQKDVWMGCADATQGLNPPATDVMVLNTWLAAHSLKA